MNLGKIKALLLNKNLVTILAVFAGIVVLWVVYNSTLNRAISLVKVPVANANLIEGTPITSDLISYIEVNSAFLKKANVITSSARLLNRYVANGTSIPKGAMFYSEQVVDKADLIERDLEEIPQGNTLYYLRVDNNSTYANSIYPGDRIDLWIKVQNSLTGNKIAYEPFITSIEVLKVKDSSRKYNVFDGSDKKKAPGYLVFSVNKQMYTLLSNIEKLGGMELIPVPKNKQYTDLQAETDYVNLPMKTRVESLMITLEDE